MGLFQLVLPTTIRLTLTVLATIFRPGATLPAMQFECSAVYSIRHILFHCSTHRSALSEWRCLFQGSDAELHAEATKSGGCGENRCLGLIRISREALLRGISILYHPCLLSPLFRAFRLSYMARGSKFVICRLFPTKLLRNTAWHSYIPCAYSVLIAPAWARTHCQFLFPLR
jgi:hypothetical protein